MFSFYCRCGGMKADSRLSQACPLKPYAPTPSPHKCTPDAHSTYGKLLGNIKITLPSSQWLQVTCSKARHLVSICDFVAGKGYFNIPVDCSIVRIVIVNNTKWLKFNKELWRDTLGRLIKGWISGGKEYFILWFSLVLNMSKWWQQMPADERWISTTIFVAARLGSFCFMVSKLKGLHVSRREWDTLHCSWLYFNESFHF